MLFPKRVFRVYLAPELEASIPKDAIFLNEIAYAVLLGGKNHHDPKQDPGKDGLPTKAVQLRQIIPPQHEGI